MTRVVALELLSIFLSKVCGTAEHQAPLLVFQKEDNILQNDYGNELEKKVPDSDFSSPISLLI